VTRADPLLATNRHIREFAHAHGLRTLVAEDGEVVIACGPRRAQVHVGFGLRAGRWYACAIGLSPRRADAILCRLRDAGCRFAQLTDCEFVADLPRGADPLPILDAHPWTRPRRRRQLSPEVRAAATARLRKGSSADSSRPAAPEPTSHPTECASGPEARPYSGARP
jgi:hypothetical protein